MSLHNHGYFFNQKKVFLMISYLIIIFFCYYIFRFSLKNENHSTDLEHIQYCFTSRDKIVSSEIHLEPANSVNDIKYAYADKYLYIKAALPDVPHNKLVLHSLNGTAKITVVGKEIFNNISGKRFSGSSYITVPLEKDMSGGTVEILIYSPLSDNLDIKIMSTDETVFSVSNIPFAFFYIISALSVVAVIALFLCIASKNVKARSPVLLTVFSSFIAALIFVLEYHPVPVQTNFLFNVKLFLYLLIPILNLIAFSIRFNELKAKSEAILSVNILYSLCIIFIGKNVFFFFLLYSGVFLQAINLLFVIRTFSKQPKPISDIYFATELVFWCINLLFWLAISLQKVIWQPLTFIITVFLCCLCNAIPLFNQSIKEKTPENALSNSITTHGGTNEAVAKYYFNKNELLLDFEDGSFESNIIPANLNIPDNSLAALTAFNKMIINKVYIRERHSLNVSEYSRIIGSYMGMSKKVSDEISKAAALHDIGKICIPEHILFKSERLTEEEFNKIKKHIFYGYKLLDSDDSFFKMAALVAKEHHEHIDGSGYMGLNGVEISLPAKIVAVADVFDALVSKRSYKDSWSFDDAVSYINSHSTDYFDKDVVDAFVSAKDKIFELYSADCVLNSNGNTEERG